MNKDELGKEICQIFEKMQLILAQKEKVLLKKSDKAAIIKITTMEIYVEQLEKYKKKYKLRLLTKQCLQSLILVGTISSTSNLGWGYLHADQVTQSSSTYSCCSW